MHSESHTDFLMMLIFVLGSICFTRWLYLEMPDVLPDTYQQAQIKDWTPPFQ
jgi:hypothetical protein